MDPYVSLIARVKPPESTEWGSRAWVQVDGTAEVLDVPDAVEALADYYRSISGEHPD